MSASTVAGSSPWMPPNTSNAGPGPPKRRPRMARPSVDLPSASNPSASTAATSVSTGSHFTLAANVRAMAIKLRDLKTEARTLARAKQYAGGARGP